MLRDVIGAMGWQIVAVIALVIFVITFVAIVIYVLTRPRREIERQAALPLDEGRGRGEPNAPQSREPESDRPRQGDDHA